MVSTGTCDPDARNKQFENIATLRRRYGSLGWPVLSVDTKKKELLGGILRDGELYSHHGEPLGRFDHDSLHLAEGKVVPHGIYDLQRNTAHITLGTSAETPAFIAESIGMWWNYRGRFDYPGCRNVLLLMDAGGANSYRHHQFKKEMLKLATRSGLIFRIAHYPSYCSKWNPIEHRLFPHVTRSMQGVYLDSVETVRSYINQRATTSTGLLTRAYILDKEFATGVKDKFALPDSFPLVRSSVLPHWNYTKAHKEHIKCQEHIRCHT